MNSPTMIGLPRPMPPNNPCGVPRVNDRRVLNGIFCVATVRVRRAGPGAPAYSGRRSSSRSSSVMAAIFSDGISGGRFGGL
jgi:hypothetical protein